MTKILREIIGAREPTFSTRINQLEQLTGKKTIDIELTANLLSGISDVTKKLNLDPYDTTPQELYASLVQKALEHDRMLRDSYDGKISELIKRINRHEFMAQIPVIKNSTLRKLLYDLPPKKVMSALMYRSVASMLKRSDIQQVIIGAFLLESVTWHRSFAKLIKTTCTISDISLSVPKLVVVSPKLISNIEPPYNFPYVQLAGLIPITTKTTNMPGGWLELSARATDGLFYVHQRGVYLKLFRFERIIVKKMVDLTYVAPVSVSKIGQVNVPWAAIYNYISRNINTFNSIDESTVVADDFKWQGSIDLLRKVHQQMDFWTSTRISAKPTESRPVSLNISDIAFNALNGVSYDKRVNAHVSKFVLDELLSQYFSYSQEKNETLKSLGLQQ